MKGTERNKKNAFWIIRPKCNKNSRKRTNVFLGIFLGACSAFRLYSYIIRFSPESCKLPSFGQDHVEVIINFI